MNTMFWLVRIHILLFYFKPWWGVLVLVGVIWSDVGVVFWIIEEVVGLIISTSLPNIVGVNELDKLWIRTSTHNVWFITITFTCTCLAAHVHVYIYYMFTNTCTVHVHIVHIYQDMYMYIYYMFTSTCTRTCLPAHAHVHILHVY